MKLFAASGEEALALVIVLDFRMPGMSGIELVDRVKSRLPWLFLSVVIGKY